MLDEKKCAAVVTDILEYVTKDPDSEDVFLFMDLCQLICRQPLDFVYLFERHPVTNENVADLLAKGLEVLETNSVMTKGELSFCVICFLCMKM